MKIFLTFKKGVIFVFSRNKKKQSKSCEKTKTNEKNNMRLIDKARAPFVQ